MRKQLRCKLCGHIFTPRYAKRQRQALAAGYSIILECPGCKVTGHHAARQTKECKDPILTPTTKTTLFKKKPS